MHGQTFPASRGTSPRPVCSTTIAFRSTRSPPLSRLPYFAAGSSNGLGFWRSAAGAALGSATWELFGDRSEAADVSARFAISLEAGMSLRERGMAKDRGIDPGWAEPPGSIVESLSYGGPFGRQSSEPSRSAKVPWPLRAALLQGRPYLPTLISSQAALYFSRSAPRSSLSSHLARSSALYHISPFLSARAGTLAVEGKPKASQNSA
jgi:hypothetical protein